MKSENSNVTSLANSIFQEYPIILDKITVATGKPENESKEIFEEVLKYLIVCGKSEGPISPSRFVDLAWHEFILHTKAYSEFCENHLAKFVHHIPGRKRATKEQYENSIALIDKEFSSGIRKEYWPEMSSASCGCDGNPNCIDRPTRCTN